MTAAELFQKYEKNPLQALLRVKRFNNALPDEYKFCGMDKVNRAIEEIDPTVFGFEDRILEMDSTAVTLPEARLRLRAQDSVRLKLRKTRGRRKKSASAPGPVLKPEKTKASLEAPAAKKRRRRRRKKPAPQKAQDGGNSEAQH